MSCFWRLRVLTTGVTSMRRINLVVITKSDQRRSHLWPSLMPRWLCEAIQNQTDFVLVCLGLGTSPEHVVLLGEIGSAMNENTLRRAVDERAPYQ